MDERIVHLREALVDGDGDKAVDLAREALARGVPVKAVIEDGIKAAAHVVGQKYDSGEYFLPELVRSGDCLKAVLEQVQGHMAREGKTEDEAGRIVIATVQGDVHDIGKNLVVIFLRGGGFAVEDMGVDVSADRVVEKALETGADIIALSCLMSVTRDGVSKVCQELRARGLRDRFVVLVGGAATNEQWARKMGCDAWASSATEAVPVARDLVAARKEG